MTRPREISVEDLIFTTLRNRQYRYPALWQSNLNVLAKTIAAILPPQPPGNAPRQDVENWLMIMERAIMGAEFAIIEDVVGQDEPFYITDRPSNT